MQNFLSDIYAECVRRQAIYDAWAKQFVQKNGWTVIPADAVAPVEFTNEHRAFIEVFEFLRDKPEKYFLYIKEEATTRGTLNYGPWIATTFTGLVLGSVTHGRPYRDNFGGVRVPVAVFACNGKRYNGTYYKSAGNYARVKMAKAKR